MGSFTLNFPANHLTLKMQETGPTLYSPYPRRQLYDGDNDNDVDDDVTEVMMIIMMTIKKNDASLQFTNNFKR